MPEIDVLNLKGEKTGSMALPARLFGQKVNTVLLHELVTMQLANQRLGTASCKSRGEVSGGGIKPYKQKHTGRARAGSTRSPLWRHGGVIFGPKPRSYAYDLPAQKKQLALVSALSAKALDNGIVVLDNLAITEPKTKHVDQILKKVKAEGPVLMVVDKVTPELHRAARNIAKLLVTTTVKVNVYEIMHCKKMIITQSALHNLEARVKEN